MATTTNPSKRGPRVLTTSPTVDRFVRDPHPKLKGHQLHPGMEVTVHGHGRFRFHALVTNPGNGQRWLDVTDARTGGWRAFDPALLRTVHRTRKLRSTEA